MQVPTESKVDKPVPGWLLVPLLPYSATGSGSSNTSVSLSMAMLGNVQFESWKNFERLVDKMCLRLEELSQRSESNEWTWQAENLLDAVRDQISPSTKVQGRSTVLQLLSERRLDRHRILRGDHAGQLPETVPEVHRHENTEHVVDGNAVGPELLNTDRSSMFGPALQLGAQSKSLEETTQLRRRICTTSTSSHWINSTVFTALEHYLIALREDPDCYLLEQMSVSSKDYRSLDPPQHRDKSEEQVKPDFALSKMCMNGVMPICTFELKGPFLKLCATTGECKFLMSARVRDARSSDRNNQETILDSGPSFEPHSNPPRDTEALRGNQTNLFRDLNSPADGATPHRRRPRSSSKRSRKKAKTKETRRDGAKDAEKPKTAPDWHSAPEIAKFYNSLFGTKDGELEDSTVGSRVLFLPVAHALSQGLQSKSGCFVLYTHQEVVCFRVMSVNTKDESSVLVKVSNCYPSHTGRGNLVPILTLMDHSMSLLEDNEELPREIRKNFRLIVREMNNKKSTESQTNPETHDQNSGPSVPSPGAGRGSNGSEIQESAEKTHIESEDVSRCLQNESIIQRLPDTFLSSDSSPSLTSSETSAETNSTAPSSVLEEDEFDCSSKKKTSGLDAYQMSMREDENVGIGTGRSGLVTRARVGSDYVAVKRWSGDDFNGLRELRNEINVYKRLVDEQAAALGNCVPMLKSARFGENDVVLVTAYVGKAIRSTPEGSLVIEGANEHDVLTVEDILEIRKAAMQCIRLLHDAGFAHGDVALRNLRVERKSEEVSTSPWKVWWIDLGRAHEHYGDFAKRIEMGECKALFAEALRVMHHYSQ